MIGSLRVGIGWADEGPRSGYFPFYIGLLIVAGSLVNFVRALRRPAARRLFAEWASSPRSARS